VKGAEAELKLASVALTVWDPATEAGTVNVTPGGIEPELSAVVAITVALSYFIVIVDKGTKFVPLTVTSLPTDPLDGFREIDGDVTVKVAEAELPLASVALTVLSPVVDGGTVNRAVNEPIVFVVTVAGEVDTAVPANVIVMAELAAKPWPDTVTDVPLGPVDGAVVIKGVTVKVAIATL
jgi:hypothetical protein